MSLSILSLTDLLLSFFFRFFFPFLFLSKDIRRRSKRVNVHSRLSIFSLCFVAIAIVITLRKYGRTLV